jgi:predicted AAA+ superfamily ATPase
VGRRGRVKIAYASDLNGNNEEHDPKNNGHPFFEEMHDLIAKETEDTLHYQYNKKSEPKWYMNQNVNRFAAENSINGVPSDG